MIRPFPFPGASSGGGLPKGKAVQNHPDDQCGVGHGTENDGHGDLREEPHHTAMESERCGGQRGVRTGYHGVAVRTNTSRNAVAAMTARPVRRALP